jgi:hypothetical protein
MEVVWQVFIPQFQVNENCVTFFITFLIIGVLLLLIINGVATIIFCNPQIL